MPFLMLRALPSSFERPPCTDPCPSMLLRTIAPGVSLVMLSHLSRALE